MKRIFSIPLILCTLQLSVKIQSMGIAQSFGDTEESLFEEQINHATLKLKKIAAQLKSQNSEDKRLQNFTNITLEKLDNAVFNYSVYNASDNIPLCIKDFQNLEAIVKDLTKIDPTYIKYAQQNIAIALTALALNTDVNEISFQDTIIQISETLQQPHQHKIIVNLLKASFDQRYSDNKGNLIVLGNNTTEIGLQAMLVNNCNKAIGENAEEKNKLYKKLATLEQEKRNLEQERLFYQESINLKTTENSSLRNQNSYNKERLQEQLYKDRIIIESLYAERTAINMNIQKTELAIFNLGLLIKSNPMNTQASEDRSQKNKELSQLMSQRKELESSINIAEADFDRKSIMIQKSTQNGTTTGALKRWWNSGK